MTAAERLWRRVDKSGACWLWLGPVNRKGYGVVSRTSGESLAHRLAFRVTHGAIPAGQNVLHKCDVPACVNPSHLFLGTIADNNADMRAKSRHAYGERNPLTKLPTAVIAAIRNASGRQAEIAQRFGVNQATVSRIKNGKTRREALAS